MGEAEAQAGDLLGRAERDREGDERAVGHLEASGGTVLGLDAVDPGGDRRLDPADRTQDLGQEIVGVDRVAQEGATELAVPPPAPGYPIIGRAAVPMGLDRGDQGPARHTRLDQPPEFADAVAEPVLVDGADHAASGLGQGGDPVDLGERAGERLLADHVLAPLESGTHGRRVERGRQADVDQVDIVAGQYLAERGGDLGPGRTGGEGAGAGEVLVADHPHLPEVLEEEQRVEMLGADPGTDDGDPPPAAHGVPSCASASAWARSASSVAAKACACGMARSLRSSTSSISRR